MNQSCGNCRFFNHSDVFERPDTLELQALCFRFPPVFLGDARRQNSHQGFGQPYLMPSEWCGEWKPRLESVDITDPIVPQAKR